MPDVAPVTRQTSALIESLGDVWAVEKVLGVWLIGSRRFLFLVRDDRRAQLDALTAYERGVRATETWALDQQTGQVRPFVAERTARASLLVGSADGRLLFSGIRHRMEFLGPTVDRSFRTGDLLTNPR
jgi:hypothetical protein